VSALFLVSILLHATADVRKESILRRKVLPKPSSSSPKASSSSSLLETKSTHHVSQKSKDYPLEPEEDPEQIIAPEQIEDEDSPPQQEQQQSIQQQSLQQQQQQQQPQEVDESEVPTQYIEQGNDQQTPFNEDRFKETKKKKGIFHAIGNVVKGIAGAITGHHSSTDNGISGSNGRITGAAGRISNEDSSCVACQFFVQTMVNSMTKYSTLFASMPIPSSQNTVTSFPPYYQPAAYRPLPPIAPYMSGYANGVMNPMARIGMVEESSKTHNKQEKRETETENELPQPDKHGNPPQYGTPRRYRSADMTYWRDRMNRIDTLNAPNPDPMREQARYLESQMFQAVYQTFEGLCASRVPELFIPYCQPMLSKFHIVSEGLHYGDRPDQICMRNDFCSDRSYIRKLPHAIFDPPK